MWIKGICINDARDGKNDVIASQKIICGFQEEFIENQVLPSILLFAKGSGKDIDKEHEILIKAI